MTSVTSTLATSATDHFVGVDDEVEKAILADLLLCYCLENRGYGLGRSKPVQRVAPAHYMAAWVDLPHNVVNLRHVPETVVAILADQDKTEHVRQTTSADKRTWFPVVGGSEDDIFGDEHGNVLLKAVGQGMRLNDYGLFDIGQVHGSLWESSKPTVIRIHRTQSDVLQNAFSSLVLYGLYKDMFRRGIQDRVTHAVIFDEAHRAAKLNVIPTMAKECRKYGVSLVLASQEARDFHKSVFSAIANYLVLRLTDADAKTLVRNVADSRQEKALIDQIKQMNRFRALYFQEGKTRPNHVDLLNYTDPV